jgi:hypothetical protein
MKRDWKKDRAKAVRHARLIAKRPELRAALYGSGVRPPAEKVETRETAQQKETP